MNVPNVMSSNKDYWETPDKIYDWLDNDFHFTLDPCASISNAKCSKFYTVDDNGLSKSWKDEIVFINPPYKQSTEWIKKAYDEWYHNKATCVLLIANRTETKPWYNYIQYAKQIIFLTPRIKFEINKQQIGSPTFGSTIVIFRDEYYNKQVIWFNLKDII
jgi:phage N-6-adenine-methyltransferase